MKKLSLILASVFAMSAQSMAHGNVNINSYADAFVFDEMGITFSVYPDGEFDFYLPNTTQATTMSNGFVNVTFNSGYDYNPYVQYDDFGAVIQVENVPIWYDAFGRVDQIGDVRISYRSQRVCQVGGLYVYYNPYGNYAYHTGFINTWNPYFVYRPYYACFARPAFNLCFVSTVAYRQYYTPVRYSYYRPYVQNVRPCYATVGHTYRPQGYGQTHHRYTQIASAGERPVTRDRQTVTTERARTQYPELARTNSVDRAAVTRRNDVATSDVNRNAVGADRRINSAPSTRQTANTVARPAITQRQQTPVQPRTVQTAPTRNSSVDRNANTNRQTIAPQSQPTQNRNVSPTTRSLSSNEATRGNSSRPATELRSQPNQNRTMSPFTRSSATSGSNRDQAVSPRTEQRQSVAPRIAPSSTQRVSESSKSGSGSAPATKRDR